MGSVSDAARGQVARSTLLTVLLTALWILVVYLTQVILAAWFGAGREMDAYLAATSVPLFLTGVLVESLNVSFVPVFVEHRTRGDVAGAWRLLTVLLVALVLVFGAVSLLGVWLSPVLMRLLVPGFEPERHALATTLSRIIFPSTLFLSIAGLLNSLHYAERRFFIPAVSPLLSAGVNLGLIVALTGQIGIVSSAWGSLWGSVAQCALALPILWGRPGGIGNALSWRDPGVGQVLQQLSWRIFGELFAKATPLVDRFIASGLAIGAISYLGYGSRIVGLALGVVSQSIGIVLFPLLAERAAGDDVGALSRVVSVGLRVTALVTMPVSAVLLTLRVPVVRVLFERQQFNAQAADAVALVLLGYAGVFLANSLGGQIVPTLYALKQARAVAWIAIAGALVYAAGAVVFPSLYGFVGLAMALSLNYLFDVTAYTYLLFVRLKAHWDANVTRFYVTCSAASAVAALLAYAVYQGLALAWPISPAGAGYSRLYETVAIGLAAASALAVYLLVLVLVRAPEVKMLWSVLGRQWSLRFRHAAAPPS